MLKNHLANAGEAGDAGLIPGLGRSPGEGNGNPLQYSCLENLIDKEPGKLQGSERIRHGLVTEHASTHNCNLDIVVPVIYYRNRKLYI